MFRFRKDGKFGILLFGDIHVHSDYNGEGRLKFNDMQKLMVASLDEYKPDLCVLLGDILSAGFCKDDPEGFRQGLKDICKPMFERNIPVAAIMGNHEHDADIDDMLVEAYGDAGILLRNDDPQTGSNADYKEILYGSDGETPKAVLWFLDSNSLYPDQNISKYDIVHPDQIKWFEDESAKLKELNGGEPVPAYIFQHIPVCEEYKLLRKPKFYELPVSVKAEITKDKTRYVGKKDTAGYVGESPCAPDINGGQFESWKKVGGVVAAFFGHDHLNDFSGYVDGIFLAQHKTAGFGCYTDGCRSCVRYVEIDEETPDKFKHELKHFKEFGLKCECLGPVFKRLSDRQSFWLNVTLKPLGGIAAVSLIAYLIIKFLIK